MKNVLSLLVVGGILAVAACGPSEAEKKAAEQKKLDSIAAVEKTKLDSLAADAKLKLDSLAAIAAEAQSDLKDAKVDAKSAKADAAAAKAKEEAAKKAAEEAAKKPSTLGKKGDANKSTESGTTTSPLKKKGN